MKLNLASLAILSTFVLIGVACAGVGVKPSSPCAGMYCVSVDIPGIPGTPELCYKTEAELQAAKTYWISKGYQVADTVKPKGELNVNPDSHP